jgi:REP element-mobilizing transposase RayT
MANTYSQIHIQFVFAVKYRYGLVQPNWKDELYKYMTGIVQNHVHKLLAINGMPGHVHLLVRLRPTQSLADLMRELKGDSSKWINENKWVKGKFEWQEGYGAFSYGISQVPKVIAYIRNQEEHHKKKTFLEEYEALLKIFKIEYDERYVFKLPE